MIRQNVRINFLRCYPWAVLTSLSVIICGIVWYALYGIVLGPDFTGGTLIELKTPMTLTDIRTHTNAVLPGKAVIQKFGDHQTFLLKTSVLSQSELQNLKNSLRQDTQYRRIENIGPKVGKEMMISGIYALTWALFAVFLYIAFRFRWQFSVCASIALIHDCVILLCLFIISGTEFNESIFVALLITAAYSINDTVVIFDRIRENYNKKKYSNYYQLIQSSIGETLSRTVLTSLTTLLALVVLCLFGGPVILSFSWPILAGVIVGTYSSIFLAAPLLSHFQLHHKIAKTSQ